MSVVIVGGPGESGDEPEDRRAAGSPADPSAAPPVPPPGHPILALHRATLAPPAGPPDAARAAGGGALERTANAFAATPAMGPFLAIVTDPSLGRQFADVVLGQLRAVPPFLVLAPSPPPTE